MARRRFKRAKRRRRRRSLNASNWGPIIKLTAVILGFLAVLYVILYIAVPKAADFIGIEYRPPFAPEATPAPTPKPHTCWEIALRSLCVAGEVYT